ncbi:MULTISPECIES: heparan-alpha-glucosaminide N-acetyltransferase domain-containing protein [Prauserella]|uniref:Heparan-alpha-glucosaminide N-acetyltransferase catalytic domain-containing protein n=2 Tax=Prauserella TaxID=142577 RepID=A0A318LC49_9PSEU|nr:MULTISPECIES: heparan-alpha-glucosaminide N-acetyltransferase domain-containing protein [Prauserella]PXY17570.1 hypothetical protein BA062_37430 [Prauserella flavalba]PXY18620.1 hypothetical protein BAY59_33625 [Prauserella coralliicola]TKG63549.1 DUF1624 domain-containing protein [Prauserella endophytica]
MDQHAGVAAPPAAARPRLVGVDVARGVAVIGMLVAHLGADKTDTTSASARWMWIFDGRSAVLFAVLAGVGLGLLTGNAPDHTRGTLRVQIALRAVLVCALGLVLMTAGSPVAVILPTYGMLFVLALPLLWSRTRTLWVGTAAALLFGTLVVASLRQVLTSQTGPTIDTYLVGELVTGYYPAVAYCGYLLAGLALSRLPLPRRDVQAGLVFAGCGMAALAYGSGAALASSAGADTRLWPGVLLAIRPHATSPFAMGGALGVAVAILGLCLLLARWHWGLITSYPLAAAGTMPLTAYSGQIVVIALLGPDSVQSPTSNWPLAALSTGTIAVSMMWHRRLGRGPLERLVNIRLHHPRSREPL